MQTLENLDNKVQIILVPADAMLCDEDVVTFDEIDYWTEDMIGDKDSD